MEENPNWKKQVMELASFYSNDFSSEGNMDMELHVGKRNGLLNMLNYLLILTKHFSNGIFFSPAYIHFLE